MLYSFLVESTRSASLSVAPMTGLLAASVSRIVMDFVWAKEKVDTKLKKKRTTNKGVNFMLTINAFIVNPGLSVSILIVGVFEFLYFLSIVHHLLSVCHKMVSFL